MENSIELGVLEFGKGRNQESLSALHHVFDYSKKADELGFSRFWLTEHHTFSPEASWNSPEILLPIIAGITNTIKVGIAGILLNVHSPYRIALNFKLLSNLFQNRIDLGLAKGIPENNQINSMLESGLDISKRIAFSDKLNLLIKCLRDEREFFDQKIILPPLNGNIPSLWYLSRSFESLNVALENKMNYSKSLFHPGADMEFERDSLIKFHEKFNEQHGISASVNMAIAIVCADSNKKAKNHLESKYGSEFINSKSVIYGSPSRIYDEINKLSELFGVQEFILLDLTSEGQSKIYNLENLSVEFNLENNGK